MKRNIKTCKGCKDFWSPIARVKFFNFITLGLYPKRYGCGVGMCCPGCGPVTYKKKKFEKMECPKGGKK